MSLTTPAEPDRSRAFVREAQAKRARRRMYRIAAGLFLLLGCDQLTSCPSEVDDDDYLEDTIVLDVTVSPAQGGTVTSRGQTCSAQCTWEYTVRYPRDILGAPELSIAIAATPGADFDFTGWTGLTCAAPASLTCDVTLASRSTPYGVTAQFAQKAPPSITQPPQDVSVPEEGTATFEVTAAGSPPLTYQWFRAPQGGPFAAIEGATSRTLSFTATLADDQARYNVVVENSRGSITSPPGVLTVVPGACPVPPMPALDESPAATVARPAVLGENLIVDPSFDGPARTGAVPAGFGYWRGDVSAAVTAQQEIVPRTGSRMLHFVGTAARMDVVLTTSGSEQMQLIDVRDLADAIDAGGVVAESEAWFTRVAGCSTTDNSFGLHLIAFDGEPATVSARWTRGTNQAQEQGKSREEAEVVDAWLRYRIGAMGAHTQPGIWLPARATLELPPGTRLIMVLIHASENRVNDTAFPELHGHYADDVSIVLTAPSASSPRNGVLR